MPTTSERTADRPVLFAYDGSELAQLAIEQAGQQLAPGRDALALCVWQPADVGFLPVGLVGHLIGSVAAAVAAHSTSSVLVVHQ